MINIISAIAYAISTFAFCYGFTTFSFAFLNRSLDNKRFKYAFIFSLMNFSCFTVCGLLNLNLVMNWIIFIFIAFIQTFFILKAKLSAAYFLSLQASLCGLNANLFYRALVAIILNIPLNLIDNVEYKLIIIPAFLSFLTCFVISIYHSRDKKIKPLRHILQAPKHLNSLLLTMSILMAYLLLQTFFYMNDKNNISIKLLSFLSCIYISFGFLWSIKYAVRFSYLYYLDDQNITLRRILHDYKEQEENLKEANDYDALTSVLNRRAGDNAINNLIENNINFCLCIVDLDGLKYVNDNLGHQYGDIYLKSIANLLKNNCRNSKDVVFRYGGDEFVIIFVEMSTYDVYVRMQYIHNEVNKLNDNSEFPMNISYGISPDSELSISQRFEQADNCMYKMKAEHKKQNPNIVRN